MVGHTKLMTQFKKDLDSRFQIRHYGPISNYCGIDFTRDRENGTGSLNMNAYVAKTVEKFFTTEPRYASVPTLESDAFSKADEPTTEEEKALMATMPYRKLVVWRKSIGKTKGDNSRIFF